MLAVSVGSIRGEGVRKGGGSEAVSPGKWEKDSAATVGFIQERYEITTKKDFIIGTNFVANYMYMCYKLFVISLSLHVIMLPLLPIAL